jgi:hypothetical protein
MKLMKLMHSDTATTVEASTKTTEVATLHNTKVEDGVINHLEVVLNHQEEATLEQAGEDTTTKIKPHPQHKFKEEATLAKEELAHPMEVKIQANGLQIAKNLPTTQHNAGQRRK